MQADYTKDDAAEDANAQREKEKYEEGRNFRRCGLEPYPHCDPAMEAAMYQTLATLVANESRLDKMQRTLMAHRSKLQYHARDFASCVAHQLKAQHAAWGRKPTEVPSQVPTPTPTPPPSLPTRLRKKRERAKPVPRQKRTAALSEEEQARLEARLEAEADAASDAAAASAGRDGL